MKKFFRGLGLTILSTILFISSFLILLMMPLRRTISTNFIKEVVTSINVEQIVTENPDLKKQIDESLEPIYEVTREVGLDDEVIIKILNMKEVKELVGDVTNNILQATLTGKDQKLITKDNINEILSDAIADINKSSLYEIKPETKDKVLEVVNEGVDEFQKFIPDTNMIIKEIPKKDQEILKVVQYILSSKFMIILVSIIISSILLIILLEKGKIKWLKISSIVILVSSSLSILVTGIISFANLSIVKKDYSYIYNVVNKLTNYSYLLSISVVIITIICLVIYHNLKKSSKQIKK